MADLEAFTRQRIDYQATPGGGLRAVLTVTLPDGIVRTYAADLVANPDAPNPSEVGAGWWFPPSERKAEGVSNVKERFRATTSDAAAMQKFMRAVLKGDLPKLTKKPTPQMRKLIASAPRIAADPRYAALQWSTIEKRMRDLIRDKYGPPTGLEKVGKAIVSVAKVVAPLALNFVVPGSGFIASAALLAKDVLPVAKKLLNSEVMSHAATELAKEAGLSSKPVSKAAALTAASVLGVSGQLGKAQQYADQGKAALAKYTAQHAVVNARSVTKSPASAAKLVRLANEKRLAADALAHRVSPAAAKRDRKRSKKPPAPATDVLAAARTGGVRSNKGGSVSEAELVKAARAGRVFWVHA